MFGLFKPKKLGPPVRLRLDMYRKVTISGTGTREDPITVSDLDVQDLAQSYANYEAKLRDKFDVNDFYLDWSTGIPSFMVDACTEEQVFYKFIGLRGPDWEWISRQMIRGSDGKPLLWQTKIENKRTKKEETYYFDHSAFFNIPGSDIVFFLSAGASSAINKKFDRVKTEIPNVALN